MNPTAAMAGGNSWSKTMFKFETIRNSAVAALFSIILTATAIGAAAGPVQIGQTAPVASAQA